MKIEQLEFVLKVAKDAKFKCYPCASKTGDVGIKYNVKKHSWGYDSDYTYNLQNALDLIYKFFLDKETEK